MRRFQGVNLGVINPTEAEMEGGYLYLSKSSPFQSVFIT
jgi:hypothetical protein